MSSKIDPRDIFVDHFRTMVDAGSKRLSLVDLTVFFVIPLAAGVGLMLTVKRGFEEQSVGIWVGALSILAGLLINVLVLLYTVKVVGPTQDEAENQVVLIKQVNANLLFAILIAVIAIILLCIVSAFDGWAERSLTALIVAILVNFTLTLMMTLKRIKVLVDLRFKPVAGEGLPGEGG